MITIALLDIYKLMQALMWVFFGVKCVKLVSFFIFHCLMRFLLVPTTLPVSIFFHCIRITLVWASLSLFGRKVWLFMQRWEDRRVNSGVHVWLKGLIFGEKIVFSQWWGACLVEGVDFWGENCLFSSPYFWEVLFSSQIWEKMGEKV